MRAYHFLPGNRRLAHGDKRTVSLGETVRVDADRIELCKYGLHASVRAIDALSYLDFDNAVICKVELGGRIIEGADKCVASERTVVAWCTADPILHEFACRVAEDVLPIYEKAYPGDDRPRKAIEAKRRWLRGEITDGELEAVCAAAWSAEGRAACAACAEFWSASDWSAAAWASANAAVWASANVANWASANAARAVRAAVWVSANAAAEEAAAKDKYNAWLAEMIEDSLKKA